MRRLASSALAASGGGDGDGAVFLDVDFGSRFQSVSARMVAPPLPITSRIFSGLIFMV